MDTQKFQLAIPQLTGSGTQREACVLSAAWVVGTMVPEGTQVPQFTPIQVGRQSFVLADRLAHCRMVFREALKEPPYEKWVAVWAKPYLPSAIRIEMQSLPQDRMRLPLITITTAVRVTRDPLDTYVDF